MAPHGSSILRIRSLKSTPPQTTMPAITPMITDAVGLTNAHGAVIATSPASIPLQAMVMSGLPKSLYHRSIAAAEPATAARFVFTATTEMRRSVAPSVEPGLKPIHPKSRRNVPVTTNTMLEAGNARGFPSAPYLPSRGPRMRASAIAHKPPMLWTTDEPEESTLAASNQEMIQSWDAAKIRGSRIHSDRAELESVSDCVVSKECKNVCREVQHHQVRGILLAHQPACQQSKARLHE